VFTGGGIVSPTAKTITIGSLNVKVDLVDPALTSSPSPPPPPPPPPPPTGITLNGTVGSDMLHGTSANETILGLNGADHLFGGGGVDTIDGGTGNDYLYGEAGADVLTGGSGNDGFVLGTRLESARATPAARRPSAACRSARNSALQSGFSPPRYVSSTR